MLIEGALGLSVTNELETPKPETRDCSITSKCLIFCRGNVPVQVACLD